MKQWTDLNSQVAKHLSRGLELSEFTEREFAMFLYSSNYYRFSGYARCFYERGSDRYVSGTTVNQVVDAYEQDRLVRNLVLDGISVVEPTLRSRVAYHFARSVGGGDDYLMA